MQSTFSPNIGFSSAPQAKFSGRQKDLTAYTQELKVEAERQKAIETVEKELKARADEKTFQASAKAEASRYLKSGILDKTAIKLGENREPINYGDLLQIIYEEIKNTNAIKAPPQGILNRFFSQNKAEEKKIEFSTDMAISLKDLKESYPNIKLLITKMQLDLSTMQRLVSHSEIKFLNTSEHLDGYAYSKSEVQKLKPLIRNLKSPTKELKEELEIENGKIPFESIERYIAKNIDDQKLRRVLLKDFNDSTKNITLTEIVKSLEGFTTYDEITGYSPDRLSLIYRNTNYNTISLTRTGILVLEGLLAQKKQETSGGGFIL